MRAIVLAILLALGGVSHADCGPNKTPLLCLPFTNWGPVNEAFSRIDMFIGKLYGAGNTREIVVTDPPYNADNTGATPATTAINTALLTGLNVKIPCGRFKIDGPLLLQPTTSVTGVVSRGQQLVGSGDCTIIESDSTSTGFSMIRSGGMNRVCTGGAGACDARLGRAARGDGCYCQTLSDCSANVCTATSETSLRGVRVSDLQLVMRKDNMIGLDALGISESHFERLRIQTADSLTHTNTVGAVFTDGNPARTGYSNTLSDSTIMQSDVCVWLRNQGNDTRLISNSIKQGNTSGCGTGLVAESVTGIVATHNLFQTTKAPVCGSPCTASTCCGGYHHGATCATAADCAEADIITHNIDGSGTESGSRIVANRIEDSNNPHIRLGCTAVSGGPCTGGGDTATPTILGNYHSGTGAQIVRTNVNASFPAVILEPGGTSGTAASVVNTLGRAPVQIPSRAEPLEACVAGFDDGTEAALVWDETLSPRRLCACKSTGIWCVVESPNCTNGTSTTCGTGSTFANLGTPANGSTVYCSDCDPPANPPTTCASAGAKTGARASRINGAWVCAY